MKQLKLNLGAGYDHRPGYLNLDIDPRTKPDKIHDVRKPLPYKKNTVKEIVLQDVLEHLTKEDAVKLLERCARVLQPDGLIHVRVPNVFSIIRKYRWQSDLLMLYLYGDTSKNGEWGAHKYGYTPGLLAEIVEPLGLVVSGQRTDDTNYVFELRRVTPGYTHWSEITLKTVDELLLTAWHYGQGKRVVWKLKRPFPNIFAKIVLRPLSLLVHRIEVANQKTATFVTQVLRYSHLRLEIKR